MVCATNHVSFAEEANPSFSHQIPLVMKKALIISCMLFLSGSLLDAQTWEEKVQTQEQRVQQQMKTQEQRVEKDFAEQVSRVWETMDLETPPTPPNLTPLTPKTYTQGTTSPAEEQIVVVATPDETSVAKSAQPMRVPAHHSDAPIANVEQKLALLGRGVTAKYFGQPIAFRYDKDMRFSVGYDISEHRISEVWKRLERTEYNLLIHQLRRHQKNLQLNDWGYCMLVNTAAHQLYPSDKNARTLFNWFILSQSGYIATVSYERSRVFLLMPSMQTLYGKTFLRGKNQKMYVLDLDGGEPQVRRAKVFSNKHPYATRVLDLRMSNEPQINQELGKRVVSFKYNQQLHHVPITVNRSLAKFYKTYPFVDLKVYMQTPLSEPARMTMVDSLRQLTRNLQPAQGRTLEEEKVNFLLQFVQHAFPYKSDRDQFGKERYLFADEMLYYPYSDCEDRSVLFAHLVKEIVGLKVVGLLYEGHAATAVRFNKYVKGDYVTYRGNRYTVCDPTYINASYGKTLPDVRGQMAKVVDF